MGWGEFRPTFGIRTGRALGPVMDSRTAIQILTLEGAMMCSPGEWIIKGVAGEFYPCKPEIFDATYEAV